MQDRIDDYIRGNMTDSERLLFEEDLKQDESLRKEYELNNVIAEGIQAARLKGNLEMLEAAIQSSERTGSIAATPWQPNQETSDWADWQSEQPTIRKSSSRSLLYKLASMAASVIVILALGYGFKQAGSTRSVGADCYAQLTAPSSRSANEVDSLMAVAYDLMGASKHKEALDVLASTRVILNQELEIPIVDEETEYNNQMAQEWLYDVDWYEAIATMRKGKYRAAKRQLKDIAASQSPYADKSKQILKEIFNVK